VLEKAQSGTYLRVEHLENRATEFQHDTGEEVVSSNTEKDPDDWVSGVEPMTGAQRSYLKTLSDQANQPDVSAENLTKAEASKRIDDLRSELKLPESLRHR
jgi:hypothetical protein